MTFPENFSKFGFNSELAPLLCTFKNPSPIQDLCWPPLLKKKDVVGIAETGSGKTLAFSMPLLSRILKKRQHKEGVVRMLVITPTRELAQQIFGVLQKSPLKAVSLVGGESRNDQIKSLKKDNPIIVVGTPGRLNDLIESGFLALENIKYFVLDEADRMLDAGFEPEIRKISEVLPKKRQTVMFSATWPPGVKNLAAKYQKDAKILKLQPDSSESASIPSANIRIEQQVIVVKNPEEREQPFLEIIKNNIKERMIIFVLYKKEAPHIQRVIKRAFPSVKICALHGDLNQADRTFALQSFIDGSTSIMIATDVAARGLDIPNVSIVINYTFPLTIEDYVHRIGRTGRAGKTGKSITLFTDADKSHAGNLVAVLKGANQPIPNDLTDNYECVTKKRAHKDYGNFYKEVSDAPPPKHVKFDD